MVKSMFAAVAGLKTHQQKMDVIGNNIANVNTYGFKKARVSFADQFYSTLSQASEAGNAFGGGNPQQVGYGSQVGSIDVNFGTGGTASTDSGMDVMIQGQGFFLVGGLNPDGYRCSSRDDGTGNQLDSLTGLDLTRVGTFNIDGSGHLVTANKDYVYGFKNYGPIGGATDFLKPTGGAGGTKEKVLEPLAVPQAYYDKSAKYLGPVEYDANGRPVNPPAGYDPADGGYITSMKLFNVGIAADGTVAGINEDKKTVVIGKIAVANVPNANALEAQGSNSYRAGANTGIVTGEFAGEGSTGLLASGRVEMSNVDLAQEFTDMITTQRGYQANTKIITVTDEMLQELVNLKR